jgi:hypothetical protein
MLMLCEDGRAPEWEPAGGCKWSQPWRKPVVNPKEERNESRCSKLSCFHPQKKSFPVLFLFFQTSFPLLLALLVGFILVAGRRAGQCGPNVCAAKYSSSVYKKKIVLILS